MFSRMVQFSVSAFGFAGILLSNRLVMASDYCGPSCAAPSYCAPSCAMPCYQQPLCCKKTCGEPSNAPLQSPPAAPQMIQKTVYEQQTMMIPQMTYAPYTFMQARTILVRADGLESQTVLSQQDLLTQRASRAVQQVPSACPTNDALSDISNDVSSIESRLVSLESKIEKIERKIRALCEVE